MIKPAAAPPTLPPPDGEPPYMTREEALLVTLGRRLRFRLSWPLDGNHGAGPEGEVVGISNNPDSQTQRMFVVRDKRDRLIQLDAAWFLPEPWMDPFYEPSTQQP